MRSIWKGTKYSIAEAALIYYFEVQPYKGEGYINYGMLDAIHDIIEIAGAKHIGPLSAPQVTQRLASSSYWLGESIRWFYKGMKGHGKATLYSPSEKGMVHYKEKLRKREKKEPVDLTDWSLEL